MSLKRSLSGIKVRHCKNTAAAPVEIMPTPDVVVLPMQQHMGTPCDVTVAVGDQVKIGQVIGDTTSYMAAPIHASVSGTVIRIEDYVSPAGIASKAVVIEADKKQERDPNLAPPVVNGYDDFLKAVRASGLVGLGGAGFPAHVKLKPRSSVDTLVINAAECEPYITSDHHIAMAEMDCLLTGIAAIKKYLDITRVVIGVEDNKPDLIKALKEFCRYDDTILIHSLRSKYPQGAEKVLVYETTGRIIAEGMLPADVGVVVMNINSICFLARYLQNGVPLVKRTVTVDGGAVANPKVLTVPLGTRYQDLFDYCGGFKSEPRKVIMGGPMMGITVYDLNSPVLKNNNAVLAFDQAQIDGFEESACIRCGRCVRACPFNLMPAALEKARIAGDLDALRELKVNLCMECGCCSYVCPAKRNLVTSNKMAKKLLREKGGKK